MSGIAAAVGYPTRRRGTGALRSTIVPPLLVIFASLFGAASAAFLPTVAHRLAVGFGDPPRSSCVRCTRPFTGWVRAGPACPCSPGSLVTVPVGAAVAALPAVVLGPSPMLPVYLLAVVPGLLLAVIDRRCLRLPDRLVGALAILGAVPSALLRPGRIGPALVAGGLVLTAYGLVALLPGGGLGLGDVKLAGALGLILGFAGWPAVVAGLVVPHLIAGPIAVVRLLRGRRTPFAFGPYLLAGALIAVTAT
jgi:leader peptidase (prepilin peptidase)/N-methyltransferase